MFLKREWERSERGKRRRWSGQKSSSKKWEVVQPKDKSPKTSSTTTHHKY